MMKWIGLGIGVFVVGFTIAVAVSLFSSSLTSNPALFLLSGTIAYVAFCFICFWMASRRVKRPGTIRPAVAISVILFIAAAYILLKPLEGVSSEPAPVQGLRFWELPTGSRIAYVHVEGQGSKRPYPVVFLHGGPGTPDMSGDLRYFGQLADWGYDVYIYDQLGSGRSSRLQDPAGYSVQRDAEDLEAIRQQIGAERMILIGHSYGSQIAAHYIAMNGNRVAQAVLISPGAIDPSDHSDAELTGRLDSRQRRSLYRELLQPRVLFVYALLQINPAAAHSIAGDKEMDARFDRVYAKTEPALHANGKRYGHRISGLGFYANQTPQSRSAPAEPDIRKSLEGSRIPALILKGTEDYLSFSSALDYKEAFTNSSLMMFEESGHNVYQDQPDAVMDSIRRFLSESVADYDSLRQVR